VHSGYISITPLKLDTTDEALLERLRGETVSWDLGDDR
jgi:broad specificity polyphosphatase/5'/3'-nucleotidase SurE